MIKYFRKRALVRLMEFAFGMLSIALALILITGGTAFGLGEKPDLMSLDESKLRAGLGVELNIEKIYEVYAEKSTLVSGGTYYLIPYKTSDEEVVLLSVYLPSKYRGTADAIMIDSLRKNNTSEDKLEVSGILRERKDYQSSKENNLLEEGVKKAKSDFTLPDNVRVLKYSFVEESMTIYDYVATVIALGIVLWLMWLFFGIMSDRNQIHVKHFMKKNHIGQPEVDKAFDAAHVCGNMLIGERYIAFMIFFKVYIVAWDQVELIYRSKLVDPYQEEDSEELVEDDALLIKLYNDVTYRVPLKAKNLVKALNCMKEREL
jgi:hypothetical protein